MKKSVAVLLSLLMMFSLMPSALASVVKNGPAKDWTVPEGYNEDEYNAIASFLETEDENGVKNGSWFPDYDVNDPSTWFVVTDVGSRYAISWDLIDGEYHILLVSLPNQYWHSIDPDYHGMVGSLDLRCLSYVELINIQGTSVSELLVPQGITGTVNISESLVTSIDLSGCSELLNFYAFNYADHGNTLEHFDVTGCSSLGVLDVSYSNLYSIELPELESLDTLDIPANHISELDLSSCPNLRSLYCGSNELSELDLSPCSSLESLFFEMNPISNIDLSACPGLTSLGCEYCEFTELDLSVCPNLNCLYCAHNYLREVDTSACETIPFDLVKAEGAGYVGETVFIHPMFQDAYFIAEPEDGAEFLGWYNEAGELLCESEEFNFSALIGTETVIIARFTGGEVEPVVGDIDGDGETPVSDALLALRAAMELIELTPEQAEAADVNGDGAVTLVDALLILRSAMGL